jgi:hypothetical protein
MNLDLFKHVTQILVSTSYWDGLTYHTRVTEIGEDSLRAAEARNLYLNPRSLTFAGWGGPISQGSYWDSILIRSVTVHILLRRILVGVLPLKCLARAQHQMCIPIIEWNACCTWN